MQSTSNKSSIQAEDVAGERVTPRPATEPSLAYRIDSGVAIGYTVNAPHHAPSSKRSVPPRIRGERPKQEQGLDLPPISDQGKAEDPQPPETQRVLDIDSQPAERADLDWKNLQAEDIAQILERRLNEIERRERLLNRRAIILAQQERMFRLWANEQRMALNHQSQELQNRQRELQQRSSDLRWLLVFGDQVDCRDSLSMQSSDATQSSPETDDSSRASLNEMELWSSSIAHEFREDSFGIRRLQS
jgi:hypothetical protein